MKILESYKKIAKSMLIEHAWDRKFGEPLPTLEDVMNEADVKDKKIKFKDKDDNDKEATVGGILKKGEKHPAYDDAKAMIDKGGDKKSDAGKLGGGDYERDIGTDADAQGEPPEGSREPDDVDDVDIKSIKQKVDDKGTHDAAQKSMEGIPRKSEKWNNIDGDWADLSTALENDDEEMLKQVLDDMEPESRKVFDQEFGADSQGSEEPDTGGGGDLDTQIAKAEKEYKSASQASMGMGQNTSTNNPGYDIAASDAFKKLKALKAKKAGKKESITINGKQYKRISESVEPTIFDPHKEAKKQLGSLYTRMKGK